MTDYLICCRIIYMPDPPTPDSISINCNRCHKMVWVAPSGQALLNKQDDTEVICMQCVPEAEFLLSDAKRTAAPGVLAELEAHGITGPEVTALQRHFNLDEPIT